MGNQLNIKGDEAYALVAEFAGESMTVAVIGAARMLEDAAQIRANMREPVSPGHSCLYGDDGLPA